jgi:hypothetical protein
MIDIRPEPLPSMWLNYRTLLSASRGQTREEGGHAPYVPQGGLWTDTNLYHRDRFNSNLKVLPLHYQQIIQLRQGTCAKESTQSCTLFWKDSTRLVAYGIH